LPLPSAELYACVAAFAWLSRSASAWCRFARSANSACRCGGTCGSSAPFWKAAAIFRCFSGESIKGNVLQFGFDVSRELLRREIGERAAQIILQSRGSDGTEELVFDRLYPAISLGETL